MGTAAIVLITAAGIWHVRQLHRAGAGREAVAAGLTWALALAVAVVWLARLPVPSPLALLDRLFRGLTALMTGQGR
ncbi:MAG: hypothetical protein Q8P31_04765 [Bacillota bacterium]|nr:hypothetical protein [Bacillota bacterium]